MSNKLRDNITSDYFKAANAMRGRSSRRRIVAYVESYDDIYFWRTVLGSFEDSTRYFEVMLPSKVTLLRGTKSVLMNFIEGQTGPDMIACVDADYDYLLQGATSCSQKILNSPYVFHTYVYAIENYQCYAPSLHDVCVAVTLNDHRIFASVTREASPFRNLKTRCRMYAVRLGRKYVSSSASILGTRRLT